MTVKYLSNTKKYTYLRSMCKYSILALTLAVTTAPSPSSYINITQYALAADQC